MPRSPQKMTCVWSLADGCTIKTRFRERGLRLPFCCPRTCRSKLEGVLAARNVSADMVQLLLEMAALRNKEGKPLYFILGSATRGVSGAAERLQHLACWFVSAEQSALLYTAVIRAEENEGKFAAAEF